MKKKQTKKLEKKKIKNKKVKKENKNKPNSKTSKFKLKFNKKYLKIVLIMICIQFLTITLILTTLPNSQNEIQTNNSTTIYKSEIIQNPELILEQMQKQNNSEILELKNETKIIENSKIEQKTKDFKNLNSSN